MQLRIAGNSKPDVMLMDISMPGGGLNAIPLILEIAPLQKIVMLTVSEASDDVTAALNSGAKGYVLKGVDPAHWQMSFAWSPPGRAMSPRRYRPSCCPTARRPLQTGLNWLRA